MFSAELSLPPDPASVSAARRFLADALEDWDAAGLGWAGAQLVSELATNAVLHARTPFRVRLDLDHGVLRIAVHDGSAVPPSQRHYTASATTGRGLNLLVALARSWGSEPAEDGKWVWCELVAGNARTVGSTELASLMDAFADPLDDQPSGVDEGPTAASTPPALLLVA